MKWLVPRKLNFWDCEKFESGSSDCVFQIHCQYCNKEMHATIYEDWEWKRGEKSGMSKIFAFCTQKHFEKYLDKHLSEKEKNPLFIDLEPTWEKPPFSKQFPKCRIEACEKFAEDLDEFCRVHRNQAEQRAVDYLDVFKKKDFRFEEQVLELKQDPNDENALIGYLNGKVHSEYHYYKKDKAEKNFKHDVETACKDRTIKRQFTHSLLKEHEEKEK